MKLYNKNNLLPGKIADKLIFTDNKTVALEGSLAISCTLPEIDKSYGEEDETKIFPENIGSLSIDHTTDFQIDSKPIIKDLALYSDKDNLWTNQTFVLTKFDLIQPTETQLDIENNEPPKQFKAVFTSTDGETINTKEIVTEEVNDLSKETWVESFPTAKSTENKVTFYPKPTKEAFTILEEFLKGASYNAQEIEMVIEENKAYLRAFNDLTNQEMKIVLKTIFVPEKEVGDKEEK